MSKPTPKPTPTPQDILRDLQLLTTVPSTTLSLLLPTSSKPKPINPKSAETILETFRPSTSSSEDAQELIQAYVKDMEEGVARIDAGQIEREGERIDLVRKVGGEIGETLEGVRL